MHRAATWTVATFAGALLLALVFTVGYVSNDGGGSGAPSQDTASESGGGSEVDFGTLDEILGILRRYYVDQDALVDQELYEAAINGLTESLADTGTFYIDAVSHQVSIGLEGTFEGIGAHVAQQGDQIVIVAPIKDSPAEAAGVQPGDVILAVNGESTEGWTVDKAVLMIRGPKGTDVTITFRHLDGTTDDVTITRDEIKVESVGTAPPGGVLRDDDGNEVTDLVYVHISDFTERTPQELEPIVRQAEESGKKGLIIDVRNNPGGLLQETVDTADLFLDQGTILIEVDSEGKETIYSARDRSPAPNIPIVVLQNQFSASGAEVLAAALRDNNRATIIGEPSFGKGTVNTAHELRDGGALFVTIALWHTPKGVLIDGVGVQPDVEVALPPGIYDPREDTQLLRAVEHLHTLQASEEPVPSSVAP